MAHGGDNQISGLYGLRVEHKATVGASGLGNTGNTKLQGLVLESFRFIGFVVLRCLEFSTPQPAPGPERCIHICTTS